MVYASRSRSACLPGIGRFFCAAIRWISGGMRPATAENCIWFFVERSLPAAWISRRNGPKMRYRFLLNRLARGKFISGFTARIRHCAQAVVAVAGPAASGRVITGHSLGAAHRNAVLGRFGRGSDDVRGPARGRSGVRHGLVERPDGPDHQRARYRARRSDRSSIPAWRIRAEGRWAGIGF